jgi:glyoxylase-like metal-dependent hydrolase (beta-lactamase superfamily II)
MRSLDLDATRVFALTDCAPAPAACAYSFPDAVLADHASVAARWFPDDLFRTRFGPFLLRRPTGDVLVDCGLGPGGVGYFPDLHGTLPDALHEVGSSLAAVTEVVFTHLHVDHVGWAPFLPNARFHVAGREFLHWSRNGAQAGLPHHVEAVARCILPLADRLLTATSDAEILPGLRLLAAEGHTPGHHALLVDNRLLIAGDLWHNPAQIAVPNWCHRADMDKPAAIAARTRLAVAAHANGWLVAAGHFIEENAFGRIEASRSGLAFRPLTA